MAITRINYGAAPDDGTGDPLRTAFQKTDNNFVDLDSRKANQTDVTTALGNKVDKATNQRLMTAAEGAKLAGIAAGATVNRPDAQTPALAAANAFSNTTASTSTTTGAITVAGGVGVQGAVHSGATVTDFSPNSQLPTMSYIREYMLRQRVERESGGRATVHITPKGQVSYFSIIPAFNLEDIDAELGTGLHPMFIVNGVEKRERHIGMYQASFVNGELLSLGGVSVSQLTLVNALTHARATNVVLTNFADHAGIALLASKIGLPRGNTARGRSHEALYETGLRTDGLHPGDATGTGDTTTGSGPLSWRLGASPWGLSDLVGNVWEQSFGLRLVGGKLQVLQNASDVSAANIDSGWMSLSGVSGGYINTSSAEAISFGGSADAPYRIEAQSFGNFKDLKNTSSTPVADAALKKLKSLMLFPLNLDVGGSFDASPTGTVYSQRSGAAGSQGAIRHINTVAINSSDAFGAYRVAVNV